MTQKTLPILGTVCAFSLVLLGFLAGCNKKEKDQDTVPTEASETKKEDKSFENKKDINFEEVKEVENSEKKDAHKDESLKTPEGEKEEEKESKKEEEKISQKDQKADRVALVEKTLEMVAKSHRGGDVEDVVLA